MLKSIVTQIWNRKRSNTWIAIELLLVFCLVWYMVDYFFVLNYNYSLPNHRDIRHTWQITLGEYPPQHVKYSAEENEPEAKLANYNRILQQLKNYPGVEAVSLVFHGGTPGSGSFIGTGFGRENDTTLYVSGQVIPFVPVQDYFRVFGLTSGGGKKAISSQDFDWADPQAIIIGRSVAQQLFPDGSAVGKRLSTHHKDKNPQTYTIAGIADDVKRFDFRRPQNMFYKPERLDAKNLKDAEISIRSASSLSDAAFAEAFRKDMPGALQAGNYYFKKMISYGKIKERTEAMFGQTNDVRMRAYLMAFFLLNILLCVVGTFWYRVNSRREETGIRKALGASKASVRNMLLAEGLCLLAAASLPAFFIEYQFVRAGLIDTLGIDKSMPGTYLPDRTMLRFLITNALSWLVMAAVIMSAIWLPARKAAAMAPADALHYE